MVPSYYFSIKSMRQHPHVSPRTSRNGTWLPPKSLGSNVGSTHSLFYHDGQSTTACNSIPPNAIPYKTFSIYYNRAIVWIVDYDATTHAVHDGIDHENATSRVVMSRADGGMQLRSDWSPISFRHYPNCISYVGQNLDQRRLRIQRSEQYWVSQILPDPYNATEQTDNPDLGGLIGELPLLIGLMALSVPETHVSSYQALMRLLGNPWQAIQPDVLARGIGWRDGRGLVVTVYANMPHHTFGDLFQYETGGLGLILN